MIKYFRWKSAVFNDVVIRETEFQGLALRFIQRCNASTGDSVIKFRAEMCALLLGSLSKPHNRVGLNVFENEFKDPTTYPLRYFGNMRIKLVDISQRQSTPRKKGC